ncbi:MAG: CoA ester lyase [Proteobacteria bacterium]|nr:CoA ester lyase [Pseudomonadota bacterium]
MAITVTEACSFLFVPATYPERLPKALASGADMVIADWEDAVAPADKERARSALADAVKGLGAAQRARLLVRVNAEGTPWFDQDLAMLAQLLPQGIAGAVIPKAERAQTLQTVAQAIGPRAALVPIIESVAGLAAADALAAAPQVARLAFGHIDFQVDAGMACAEDESELLPIRMAVVLAARRAGIAAPIDGVTVDTQNPERMRHDADRARRMGFGAKLCIHPAQVAVLHAAFDPGDAAVAQARRVQQALQDAGGGVCVLDGRMVDAPVLLQARQTLARHARALQRQA